MSTDAPLPHLPPALARTTAEPLLLGLSGGLDSCTLLHALAQHAPTRRAGLRAIHVHHGLHADADQWAGHCERFCSALDIHLTITRVTVPRNSAEGLEAAARTARYAAFEAALAANETLVTAHHRDDQAETFLLRALRGAGPDGLAAMRTRRNFATSQHWRPLLDTPRSELLAYAQLHGLSWLDDPSNADPRHDRNFLRLHVLPLLRQRWPHADAAFSRSANLNADAAELLGHEDACALARCRSTDAHALSVRGLLALSAPRRARVLRHWIDTLGLPPLPGEGVAQIESDLLPARSDARARFAWRGVVIQRWRDLLHAQRVRTPLPAHWCMGWDGGTPLPLPGGGALSLQGAAGLYGPCQAFARQGGERIMLPGRTHSHTLKNVLQALGVPPWEREVLPLLRNQHGELLAIADYAYSAGFDAWLRTRGAHLHWRREA